jgi:hypothetical protein
LSSARIAHESSNLLRAAGIVVLSLPLQGLGEGRPVAKHAAPGGDGIIPDGLDHHLSASGVRHHDITRLEADRFSQLGGHDDLTLGRGSHNRHRDSFNLNI